MPPAAWGPILGKISEAAAFVKAGQVKAAGALSPSSIVVTGVEGVFVHVDLQQATGCIVLTFVGNEDKRMVVWDHRTSRSTCNWMTQLDDKMQVHGLLLEHFTSLAEGDENSSSLESAMVEFLAGRVPRRILCTGHALGGALATIAAIWASALFPTSDVRCITFGAPRVGNRRFAEVFLRLVGISYRVIYETDPLPSHNISIARFRHVHGPVWLHRGDILLQKRKFIGFQRMTREDGRLDKYLAAIDACCAQAGGSCAKPNLASSSSESSSKSEDVTADARALDASCPTDFDVSKVPGSLEHVLLEGKIYQAAILAFAAYAHLDDFRDTTGLKDAAMLEEGKTDVQVYVAWLEGGTAIFSFRGTWNRSDVMIDLDARRTRVLFLDKKFKRVRCHMGFYKQFAAVTDPVYPMRHIGHLLRRLSGGKTPTRVICCGHSLGGAVATLCGAWAAFEYPDADVRCISFGSPRVGNAEFCELLSYLVGANHRVLHASDPVPSMPPAIFYRYMCSGMVCGHVSKHFMTPYSQEVEAVIGRDLSAERTGIYFSEAGNKGEEPGSGDQDMNLHDAAHEGEDAAHEGEAAHDLTLRSAFQKESYS